MCFFYPKNIPAASAAEVTSNNVVGYAKIDLAAGYNLIGSQFLNVGGTTKDVNEFIFDGSGMAGLNAEFAFQTTMRVWTGNGYTTYGWLDGDDGTGVGLPDWDSKWLLEDMSALASEDMDLAKGVWIYTPNEGTVTVLGEIATGDTYTINVNEGFNLISNPFPCEISIQNIQTDVAGLSAEFAFQTTMRVWTGNGYTTYGWLDGDDGTGVGLPDWDSKWLLEDMSAISPATLKVGEAIWLVAPSAGTVTFTK